MFRTPLVGLDRRKLRLWLSLFFVALIVPTGLLIYQAYSQLKWEAFHQHRLLAEELSERIDSRLHQLVANEEKRSFSDYSFLLISGDAAANYLQRSPLAAFPVATNVPGLIGYFQVDTDGLFSTPLLPLNTDGAARYGVSRAELGQRAEVANILHVILSQNQLVEVDLRLQAGDKFLAASRERLESDDTMGRAEAPTLKADLDYAFNSLDEEETKLVRQVDGALISSTESVMGKLPQRSAQAAFDRLKDSRLDEATSYKKLQKSKKVAGNLGRVEELQLDQLYPAKTEKRRRQSDSIATELEAYAGLRDVQSRIQQEQTVIPQAASAAPVESNETSGSAGLRIRTFESEIDPFEFSMLDSGHFVLYRKVWRDGQRYVQGLLIEQQAFLHGAVEAQFRDTAIARMSNLIVAYQGEVFSAFSSTTAASAASRDYIESAAELSGALLSQARMSAPFGDLELIFSINHLPVGPGASVIAWLSGILLLVLCGGFYLMYRLAGAQIDLTRQQQDFVSAVSHELKTPLTSIRMYGEILREGWASEEKKKSYYDYIHDESERLSRLIENVLQLARMTRNDLKLDCQPANVAELIDIIRSRVASQVERAGFVLNLHCSTQVSALNIHVDSDSLVQIIINLVDNAIKFSSNTEQRQIDIDCSLLSGNIAQFSVRDYGPGIDKDQMKRIFRLFYRTQNELTRETVGTGIGLALVRQLAQLMNAKVDVVNKGPGAEFTISFAIV